MLALIGGLRGILAAIGGAGAAFLIFLAWNAVWDNPRIREAGRAEERILWTEARNRMLAQMAEEKRKAQAAIDQIEREYIAQRERDAEALKSLEQQLEVMEAENAADSDRPSAVFPGGVVRELDKIGK